MVNAFTLYDIAFLIIFSLAVVIFLYTRRKKVERQGLLYLYKTQIGVKFMDKFAKKYAKLLKPLQYLIVLSGFALMISMTWLLIKFSWFYITSPIAAKALKIPVLIPLVPYLPDIFKIDFLPSFNFTYWIIIIAIIAIPHEFAHGIFMRLNKIRAHSTGFGFLGPFIAFFVEQDEKDMQKAKKFPQMAILAAGTFANVLFTIIFGLIFWLFFISSFTPVGVNFNAYATSSIPISQIQEVNGIEISFINQIPQALELGDEEFTKIKINSLNYFTTPQALKLALESQAPNVQAFDDSPAFNSRLEGAITEINGQKTKSLEELREVIHSHEPGDTIEIKTLYQESIRTNNVEERSYTLQLDEREGQAYLGIGIIPQDTSGITGFFFNLITKIKDPFIFYQSSLGAFGWFIYFFLWWTVIISLSVALVNMLPVGIFDGGRFFMLTVWGITRSERIAKRTFAFSTWLILALVLALMIKWLFIFV